MSYTEAALAGEFVILKGIHFWNPNFAAEMGAIVTALGTETATHDRTIEKPSSAILRLGEPGTSVYGSGTFTRLTNDIILLVNAAKGGNLANSQIIAALDDALGTAHAPANIDVPFASANASPAIVGTVCTCTVGTWAATPSSYAYQWKRDGATNLGTAANYTLIAADVGGHAITCIVTATNATGSTAAPPSNAIAT